MRQVCSSKHPSTQKFTGEVIVRPANGGDGAGILQCLAAAFEPYRADYTSEAFADTVLNPESLAARLQNMRVLVAADNGIIVGTISASWANGEGHLRGMAVLPDWRGTGLSAKLLHAIETWLRERGCKRVTLDTTLPLKAAIRFYERNAYRRSGKVSDFFGMPLIEYVKELS